MGSEKNPLVRSGNGQATSGTITKPLHVPLRFVVAGLFLVLLVNVMDLMARWRSVEREVHLSLGEGALAAVVVVFLFPVLRRGDRWQRVLAVLLLIIPVIGLLDSLLRGFGTILNYSL